MAKIDLTKMTHAQLLDLKERVDAAVVERRAAEAEEVKAKLEALAQKSGFSLAELAHSRKPRSRKPAMAAKFRNPKEPSQTWSGRGRKPNWLVEALGKGAKLERFAA